MHVYSTTIKEEYCVAFCEEICFCALLNRMEILLLSLYLSLLL